MFFVYLWFQSVSSIPCPVTAVRTLPTLEVKQAERPSSKSKDPPRDEEKEKKRKKHKKRSRTRSRSPFKYHSSSKSRSRSHSKAKHSLPTAYRTVRHSRWVWKPTIFSRVLCELTRKKFLHFFNYISIFLPLTRDIVTLKTVNKYQIGKNLWKYFWWSSH